MILLKHFFAISVILFFYVFKSPSFDWFKYDDKDCEILFPKIPVNDTIVRETSIGTVTFYRHILTSKEQKKDSTLAYELIKSEYPPTETELKNPTKEIAESLFKGAISSSLKQVNGKLISEKEVDLGDYYGKEVKISFDNNTKLITMRCYLAKSKVYAIETISPLDKGINSSSTIFLSSFKIK